MLRAWEKFILLVKIIKVINIIILNFFYNISTHPFF